MDSDHASQIGKSGSFNALNDGTTHIENAEFESLVDNAGWGTSPLRITTESVVRIFRMLSGSEVHE